VQGAVQVMRKLPAAVSIFILPPSPEVLERRLRNRSEAEHMTNEEVIARRLREAQSELGRIGEYKYALVNDQLDVAVRELAAIVRSERGEGDGEELPDERGLGEAAEGAAEFRALGGLGVVVDGIPWVWRILWECSATWGRVQGISTKAISTE
jgi:hypothetical protein